MDLLLFYWHVLPGITDFNGVQSPSSVDNETIDGTSSSSPVSSDDGKSKQVL